MSSFSKTFLRIFMYLHICVASVGWGTPSQVDCSKALEPQKRLTQWVEGAQMAWTWFRGQLSNSKGVLAVFDQILFRPLPGGLLPESHPWVTGINPQTGQKIWMENVVYSSERDPRLVATPTDREIVEKVGTFLANMVDKPASSLKHPFGVTNRMPIAVNYLHGAVHYNSGIIVFNDIADGIRHISDRAFTAEMQRFTKESGREMVIIFRDRDFKAADYAQFIGVVRAHLPWFANPNGNVRKLDEDALRNDVQSGKYVFDGKVLWGAPSPYPVVNPISGNWIDFMRKLRRAEKEPNLLAEITLPPIEKGRYFQSSYGTERESALPFERWIVGLQDLQIRARAKGKGNVVFTDNRELEREKALLFSRKVPSFKIPAEHHVPVIVIGAGPAGLNSAHLLKKAGVDVLVLEKGSQVGSGLSTLPSNYRFAQSRRHIMLDDSPREILPREKFVTVQRYRQYLEDYVLHHELAVSMQSAVSRVQKLSDGRLEIQLMNGQKLTANKILDASGSPLSEIPFRGESTIPQLKIQDYRDPQQIAEYLQINIRDEISKTRILIVGEDHLAGEALHELQKAGFQVTLASESAINDKLLRRLVPPMLAGRSKELVKSGAVSIAGPLASLQDRHVKFADGSEAFFDLILHSGDSAADLSHLPAGASEGSTYGVHVQDRHSADTIEDVRQQSLETVEEVLAEMDWDKSHPLPTFYQDSRAALSNQPQADFSALSRSGRVPLKKVNLEKDLVIAFASKCGHASVYIDGLEYHGRFWFNRVKVKKSQSAQGGVFFHFPDLGPEQKAKIFDFVRNSAGKRSINCFDGLCKVLASGGIYIKDRPKDANDIVDSFDKMVQGGFVNANSEPVQVNVYASRSEDLAEMRRYLIFAVEDHSLLLKLNDAILRIASWLRGNRPNSDPRGLSAFLSEDGQGPVVWMDENK